MMRRTGRFAGSWTGRVGARGRPPRCISTTGRPRSGRSPRVRSPAPTPRGASRSRPPTVVASSKPGCGKTLCCKRRCVSRATAVPRWTRWRRRCRTRSGNSCSHAQNFLPGQWYRAAWRWPLSARRRYRPGPTPRCAADAGPVVRRRPIYMAPRGSHERDSWIQRRAGAGGSVGHDPLPHLVRRQVGVRRRLPRCLGWGRSTAGGAGAWKVPRVSFHASVIAAPCEALRREMLLKKVNGVANEPSYRRHHRRDGRGTVKSPTAR